MLSWLNSAQARPATEIVEKKCSLCHGIDGEGSSAIYPRLAGQHAEYIAKQLADFKSGRRKGTMNEMAADLSPEEMKALGEYFAAKPTKSHKVRNKDFSAVGYYLYHNGNQYTDVPACESCHGAEGNGTVQLPRLAGQHKRYLMGQLQDFNSRKRNNDNAIMHSIASKLTELEIDALALYISGMK
ncbi:MAG: cytochrome c4 [Gammaproteobacteria bacterium]|nr:cytochrome c4 [Gammaproteobacteria bacterium]MCW8888642.1 cytochrome c4 [Gammaproteobacteria bacterium]